LTAPYPSRKHRSWNMERGTSSGLQGGDGAPDVKEKATASATRIQLGAAMARRHTAPIASMVLWAGLCGALVVGLHAVSAGWGMRLGSYRTGLTTLSGFLLAALYPLRKYSMWFSVRGLRIASRLPARWAVRILLFDRLETWRVMHITVGVLSMLPFWWHTQFGRQSLLELALELLVILLVLSGFVGTFIEDFLPARMLKLGNREVRLQDVEAAYHELYVEAEELVLGHSEALVHAYLLAVRPILVGDRPLRTMLWATLRGTNPAPAVCKPARLLADRLASEAVVFQELVNIAERKVQLEHNQFNLRFGMGWLRLHGCLAMAVLTLIVFHIAGVLYFVGV
jgi:hypothetical protein